MITQVSQSEESSTQLKVETEEEKSQEINQGKKFGNVWINQNEKYQGKQCIKAKHLYEIKDNDALCLRYSQDGKLLAVGCADGKVYVFNTQEEKLSYTFQPSPTESPTTILRWRPKGKNYHSAALLVGNCEGSVSHFHGPTGKLIFRNEEQDNQVLGMDYRDDGMLFATGGKDFTIRVYDEQRKSITAQLYCASWQNSGHTNRVFAINFLPSSVNPNLLLTGGWDSNIHLWDLRNQRSVSNFYGANVSGDSVKYYNEQIFIGSYRKEPALEIYDWRTMQLVEQLWKDEGGYVYGIEVRNGKVAAVGAGKEARLYGKKSEIGRIVGENPWYSVDWDREGKVMAVGGTGGEIYEFNVDA